jgi:hypothetical protein
MNPPRAGNARGVFFGIFTVKEEKGTFAFFACLAVHFL